MHAHIRSLPSRRAPLLAIYLFIVLFASTQVSALAQSAPSAGAGSHGGLPADMLVTVVVRVRELGAARDACRADDRSRDLVRVCENELTSRDP